MAFRYSPPRMKRPRVLLVEDDVDDATIVEREYSVTDFFDVTQTVRTVDAAIAYLEGRGAYADRAVYRTPDLLLLDMRLGLGSGLEIIRFVRASDSLRRLPIIVLAASKSPAEINEAYLAGINSYVAKPNGAEEMSRVLRGIGHYWSICALIPGAIH